MSISLAAYSLKEQLPQLVFHPSNKKGVIVL